MFYPELLYYKELNKLERVKCDRLISKAIEKNLLTEEELDNCSEIALDALFYPSIRMSLKRLMKKFCSNKAKLYLKEVLSLSSKEELVDYLKKCQEQLKKHPLSFLRVPTKIKDDHHHLYNSF